MGDNPLVNIEKAIENGPVDLYWISPASKLGGSFQFVMLARLPEGMGYRYHTDITWVCLKIVYP